MILKDCPNVLSLYQCIFEPSNSLFYWTILQVTGGVIWPASHERRTSVVESKHHSPDEGAWTQAVRSVLEMIKDSSHGSPPVVSSRYLPNGSVSETKPGLSKVLCLIITGQWNISKTHIFVFELVVLSWVATYSSAEHECWNEYMRTPSGWYSVHHLMSEIAQDMVGSSLVSTVPVLSFSLYAGCIGKENKTWIEWCSWSPYSTCKLTSMNTSNERLLCNYDAYSIIIWLWKMLWHVSVVLRCSTLNCSISK